MSPIAISLPQKVTVLIPAPVLESKPGVKATATILPMLPVKPIIIIRIPANRSSNHETV
jgi:hypothetical protein